METAKTGRAVIEKAETFTRTLCLWISICLESMESRLCARSVSLTILYCFYVVSAYDKFDYAKEAIDLGVEKYLTKPISKSKIIL
mgnify:CR=1 FL=1